MTLSSDLYRQYVTTLGWSIRTAQDRLGVVQSSILNWSSGRADTPPPVLRALHIMTQTPALRPPPSPPPVLGAAYRRAPTPLQLKYHKDGEEVEEFDAKLNLLARSNSTPLSDIGRVWRLTLSGLHDHETWARILGINTRRFREMIRPEKPIAPPHLVPFLVSYLSLHRSWSPTTFDTLCGDLADLPTRSLT